MVREGFVRGRSVVAAVSWLVVIAVIVTPASWCAQAEPTPQAEGANVGADGCTSPAVNSGAERRVALLVGVGKYAAPEIRPLAGPPNDVQRMYALLTEQYGFPPENVCRLVDEKATTAEFRRAFDRTLVQRVRQGSGDVAVLFIAAHGSQVPDENGDEGGDGWDETIVFHDARTPGVDDLVDDELATLLGHLHERIKNVVLILDSCNSGTADRGPGASTFVARFVGPPAGTQEPPPAGPSGGLDDPWVPTGMSDAVVFAAATDGTSALETGGYGIFTSALVDVLGNPGPVALSYAQAARRIPLLVTATGSAQVPLFRGGLDREVFGTAGRARPMAWEVRKVGPPLELSGPPTPGMGPLAELRLYAPSPNRADYSDPAKSKATLVVDAASGLNATAHVAAAPQGATPPQPGDFAIMVRPSDEAIRISVRLRPSGEPGGIPAARAEALRQAVAADVDASSAVILTAGAGDFELNVSPDGVLQLRDPQNRVRNTLRSTREAVDALWRHARQKAIRFITPEGGAEFDDHTLTVRLVPVPEVEQLPCARQPLTDWVDGTGTGEQVIPLCVRYNIEVRSNAPMQLLIGGVVLASDGSTIGFPNGNAMLLDPGHAELVKVREAQTGALVPLRLRGTPPLGAWDYIRVFGTQVSNPVRWDLLSSDFIKRSVAAAPSSALHRALHRYLTRGERGEVVDFGAVEDTTWAATGIAMHVEANPRFAGLTEAPPAAAGPRPKLEAREYTIPRFDLRPYLPDDSTVALSKVLQVADRLAQTQVGYRQHAWTAATDRANLELGIDCSRAIWYAFTRAGLPYNGTDAYLTTAAMSSPDSPMADEFDRCDDTRRLGDVLVYRDPERGDGHVVMVIDADRRIAWGSHGWDGNAGELAIAPQTGVEYQRIKHKPDWLRWDRPGMRQTACWRYRQFAADARTGRGLPGVRELEMRACDPASCRVDRALKPPS